MHLKLLKNMKNKFMCGLINRLLKWSIRKYPEESQRVYLKKTEVVLKGLYSTYNPTFDGQQFDRDIFKILFNIKYHDPDSAVIPYEQLNSFYELAKEGNNSFLRQPFFRLLRINKDKEVKKLLHILDRNSK